MSQFDEKIELYRNSLVEKCGITPDETLLKAVTKGLGPSIYNADAEIVAASEKDEVTTLKENFIKKKLGISDEAQIDEAVEKVFGQMGKSNPRKFRAVLCYLLVLHFKKENLYK